MDIHDYFEFTLLTFTSIFTMVNPLSVIPVYTSMTSTMEGQQARRVAYKAVLTAFFIMVLFAIMGKFIFAFFHISVNSLRIVGGIIFFMTGFDMLEGRLVRMKSDEQITPEYANDIAITPLGIPLICGPGAITASIVHINDANTIPLKIILIGVILIVQLVTLIFLLSARRVTQFLGTSGNKVLMRLMGLIVMVMAVEFLFSGLKPIIRDIFRI